MKRCLAAAAALAIAAAPAAAPAAAACPNAGLKTRPVAFVTATGRHRYSLEVAASPAEQQCGLMYRTAMPQKIGMIFPFTPPRPATFWMENTPLSLDLIFVAPDDRVLNIAAGATPQSRDLIASNGVTAAVIELNAGEAARIGLKPGDRVER